MKTTQNSILVVALVVTLGLLFSGTAFGVPGDPPTNPGVGTPGYWKTHPDAWPISEIYIGGIWYSMDAAIKIMKKPTKKDMATVMFMHLVAAKLNVRIGNSGEEVRPYINLANVWMYYNPLGDGKNVTADSDEWQEGEPIKDMLDAYNNGLLDAPARD